MPTPEQVEYEQFREGSRLRAAFGVGALAMMPFALPLALLARLSNVMFRSIAETLALVPYVPGIMLRNAFYRLTLPACGRNVIIEFGTVLLDPRTRIGDNVLIGRFNVVDWCDIRDWVLTAERCSILSGARYHSFGRSDVPIATQGGEKRCTLVGPDVWVGAHGVVMDDVGAGAVVAAGAVVTRPVDPGAIVMGVPARVVRRRIGFPGVEA